MLRIVLLTALVALAAADTADLNKVVDVLLDSVRKTLRNELDIPDTTIPDITQHYHKKIGFFDFYADFTADGGWLKNVSTLTRTGPLKISQSGNDISASVSLGLKSLDFGFDSYRASVMSASLDGKVNVGVGQNSITSKVTMHFPANSACTTTLDELEVDELDGLDVQMTGHIAQIDWVYSRLVEFIAKVYKDKIKSDLSEQLRTAAEEALAKNDICDKFIDFTFP